MPYQFRQFKRLLENQKSFRQLDLYFYKAKSYGVGVKARFLRQEVIPLKWKITDVELKVITNLKDIQKGKTNIQKWKKIASTSISFELCTPAYIQKNPQEFGINLGFPLETAARHELERVSSIIAAAFRKNQDIEQKLYQKNEDLKRWLADKQKLADVLMVEKNREKGSKSEKGVVKITSLFVAQKIAPCIFQTLGFESHSQQQVEDILKKKGLNQEQNISYPRLLENLYFKLI